MSTVPLHHTLLLSGMLFALGIFGLLFRKNLIFILMSLEVMLNACGLAFVAIGNHYGRSDGQIMFLLIITVAAAEVALGLALAIKYEQRFGTLDINPAKTIGG